jgi:hypothetical protein
MDGTFKVVGECFVSSLRDSIGILGQLPEPWTVQYRLSESTYRCYYVNTSTGEKSFCDPRLGPLEGWEMLGGVPESETSILVATFRNCETGEVMNSDPRLSPDGLKNLGADIRSFHLI